MSAMHDETAQANADRIRVGDRWYVAANAARVALEAADLDAVETSPLYIGENSYNVRAPYLTAFALIPKFEMRCG